MNFDSMQVRAIAHTYASALGLHRSSWLLPLPPRQYCYLETTKLLWVNLVMDASIALSYAVIFFALMWITKRLADSAEFRKYLWISLSFGLFILACGGTHLMDVVNLWIPSLNLSTEIRIACALASVPTAIMFSYAAPALASALGNHLELLHSATQQRDVAEGALTLSDAIAKERTQAATELADANYRLKAVMDSTTDGIFHVSRDWCVLYGNRIVVESLPDFKVGANFWKCFPALQEKEAERRLRDCMELRSEERFENFYEPYRSWYRTHAFPTEEGISVFYQDITVEKSLEAALRRERELRERHIESLSHIAGGLAHEISNPLGIIHARASDLEDAASGPTPPTATQIRAATSSIIRTTDRAIRILKGLKALSRDDSNDAMELADLSSICRECLETLSSRLENHQIELRVALAPDVPPVLCREVQIAQVITNLLNNATDAIVQSASTSRWISVEVTNLGHAVRIRIANGGPAIDASVRSRMMEPFFTTKEAGLGTGVGLSISRAIVIDHGGTFELVEDLPYTCFQFVLPIGTPPSQPVGDSGGMA
jgi:signal transduction histidine kinase